MKLKSKWNNSKTKQSIKYFLQNTWYLLKTNWKMVLPFLVVYSIFNILVSKFAIDFSVWLALKLAGMDYVGPDNLKQFFMAPTTILLVILFLLGVCFLNIVEIAGIMHVYSVSNVGKTTTLKGIISTGLTAGMRSFSPKNWLIIPFIIVLLPLTGFFSLSFSSFRAVIPGFITDVIVSNSLYLRLYMALYFVMLLIEITYIFVLNFYLLSDDSFTSAGRKSRRLIKDHYIFTVIALILTIIIFSTITTSFAASVSSLALKLLSFSSVSLSAADARTLSNWIIIVNIFVGSIFAPAINIAALTSLFYQYIEEKDMLSSLSKKAFNDKYLKPYQVALFALAIAGLAIANVAIGYDYITTPQPKVNANLEIVAHRGDATNAPDNSMPAFELALLESAEWIELDVQQTKDGVVIVSHDDEISRVSGQHLYIHNLTYEEATSLDVGSYFSSDFSDVRFSTLDEVLKLCKDKVKVMVEIKHNDYLVNMEEQVLQIINDNGMHDQCLIISTHTPTLMRIKELDPTMITCYTMFVAYGDVGSIPYVDYYTIEERNINSKLVTDIHRRGGKVYAWTINSEDSLQYLIDCSVDGILTDNPAVMYKYEKELAHDTGLARWLRIYINDLKDF